MNCTNKIVIDCVCKDDEHLVTNLSLLKFMKNETIYCRASAQSFYLQYGIQAKRIKISEYLYGEDKIHLTVNWSVLFLTTLMRRKDVLIFHNFFDFITSKNIKGKIKKILFKYLVKVNRGEFYVLSKHIAKNLNNQGFKFRYLPLVYDKGVIEYLGETPLKESIELSNKNIVLGNLYEGKISGSKDLFNNSLHLGKIYGNYAPPLDSINRYLEIKEYYFALKRSKNVIVSYSEKYNYIASGIIADIISTRENFISNLNPYTLHLIDEYQLTFEKIDQVFIKVYTNDLHQKMLFEIQEKIR